MKNLHLILTDKPSRLYIDNKGKYNLEIGQIDFKTFKNIYITNDEYIGLSYYIDGNLVRKGVIDDKNYWELRKDYKKIILTTDSDLIKNDVQAIDDEFLEWFINNNSCEQIGVKKYENGKYWTYEINIPTLEQKLENIVSKQPSKFWQESNERVKERETLEEVAERFIKESDAEHYISIEDFLLGVKSDVARIYWQQKQDNKKYSEEEVTQLLIKFNQEIQEVEDVREWFQQFKKKQNEKISNRVVNR